MLNCVVHQIWMNPKENDIITKPGERHIKYMKDWRNCEKYYLWNHITMREFIMEQDNTFLEIYDKLPLWINRCDVFRYFVLYYIGGIYADCDLEIKSYDKMNELIDKYNLIFVDSGVINFDNYFIYSIKEHKFMEDCYKTININSTDLLIGNAVQMKRIYSLYNGNDKLHAKSYDLPVHHYASRSWLTDYSYDITTTYILPVGVFLIIVISLLLIIRLVYEPM